MPSFRFVNASFYAVMASSYKAVTAFTCSDCYSFAAFILHVILTSAFHLFPFSAIFVSILDRVLNCVTSN